MDVRIINSAIIITAVSISGCSSFTPHWERYKEKESESESVQIEKNYNLLQEYRAVVGDPMVEANTLKSDMTQPTYYTVERPGLIAWRNNPLPIGSKWNITYLFDNQKDGDYILTSNEFYRHAIGIIAKEDGTIPANPVIRVDRKGSFQRYPAYFSNEKASAYQVSTGASVSVQYKKEDKSEKPELSGVFKKHNSKTNMEKDFGFELVYAGKQENNVKITYREYKEDFIRSSFNQELSYNMNESDIISFRSLKIKILNAGNTHIEYQVLEDKGLSWLIRQ